MDGDKDQEILDFQVLKFFALYTCKQKADKSTLRIANEIAQESKSKQSMQQE